jgi:hypothetical protein
VFLMDLVSNPSFCECSTARVKYPALCHLAVSPDGLKIFHNLGNCFVFTFHKR